MIYKEHSNNNSLKSEPLLRLIDRGFAETDLSKKKSLQDLIQNNKVLWGSVIFNAPFSNILFGFRNIQRRRDDISNNHIKNIVNFIYNTYYPNQKIRLTDIIKRIQTIYGYTTYDEAKNIWKEYLEAIIETYTNETNIEFDALTFFNEVYKVSFQIWKRTQHPFALFVSFLFRCYYR